MCLGGGNVGVFLWVFDDVCVRTCVFVFKVIRGKHFKPENSGGVKLLLRQHLGVFVP